MSLLTGCGGMVDDDVLLVCYDCRLDVVLVVYFVRAFVWFIVVLWCCL